MKTCKFLVALTAVATMYVAPASADWGQVVQTGTDSGPNARPCGFAAIGPAGNWVAILKTDPSYAHDLLILKTARDHDEYVGYTTGPGIGACDNLPSLIWVND